MPKEGKPHDFICVQHAPIDVQDKDWADFKDEKICCRSAFVGRRVLRRVKAGGDFQGIDGWDKLVNFWVADPDGMVSTQNERQNGDMNRIMFSKKRNA